MAAAGITALLKKMDYKDVVVAIDGKHCLIIESFYIYFHFLSLQEVFSVITPIFPTSCAHV